MWQWYWQFEVKIGRIQRSSRMW